MYLDIPVSYDYDLNEIFFHKIFFSLAEMYLKNIYQDIKNIKTDFI